MASVFEATAGKAIGYVSGGAVTQLGSKGTVVTLNQPCGQITMNAQEMPAGARVTFTVTDSFAAAGDVVLVNHSSAGTAGAYFVQANTIAAGSFNITVGNFSAGALAEAIVLNFAILKAAAA